MSILNEQQIINETVLAVAKQMITAAKTAPKACGIDNLSYIIVTGNKLEILANKMIEIGNTFDRQFFIRDAENIRNCSCLVLLGTKISAIGLQDICGLCGFGNCIEKEKHPTNPCIYNTNDLGIAIGSAVSIAANNRIDNRVMFSVAKAAKELNMMDAQIILGIPLSATAKNIFYDRK